MDIILSISHLILINGELYGLKSKFHMQDVFFFRELWLTLDDFPSSTLDDRLITDGRLLEPAEEDILDDLSAFPDEELPPLNKLSSD